MESKVANVAAAQDPNLGHKPAPKPRPETGKASPGVKHGPDPADMRLVIEEDKATGSYIYKTVNRVTGEVIQQLPREDILKLRDQVEYVAGTVISAQA